MADPGFKPRFYQLQNQLSVLIHQEKQGLGTLVDCRVGEGVPADEAHFGYHRVPWDHFTPTPKKPAKKVLGTLRHAPS